MIYKTNKKFLNYFLEHFLNEDKLCGLCGNTGIVKTTPSNPMKTKKYNFETFCICPNGQCLRDANLTQKDKVIN